MKNRLFSLFTSLIMVISLLGVMPSMTAWAGNGLNWPVPGHTNLSQGYHSGYCIDINDGSIAGATVVAAKGGTVYKKYTCSTQHYGSKTGCDGFGTGLIIKGDDGRYYGYAHMQGGSIPSNVYVGAYVFQGQKIGQVGKTGNASGYHLHFYCGNSPWKGDIQISKNANDYNGGSAPINNSSAPAIGTPYTTTIGTNSAYIKCTIGRNGSNWSQVGAYFGTTSACSNKAGSDNLGSVNSWAGYTLSNLAPDTTYYYKFYIIANGTTYWSSVRSFKTQGHTHSYTTNYSTNYYTKKTCSCGKVVQSWSNNYVDLGDDFYAHIENTQHHNYLNNIDGNVVSKWFKNWNSKMTWRFKKQSNGYYIILNCSDGRALDVYGADSKSGANVGMYQENGTDAQLWRIYGTPNSYVLKPKCSNCVLDLTGNVMTDGANIEIYDFNLTGAQKYSISKHNHELYMPNNWTITKAATCTNQGNKEKKCACCGYIEKATIPAIGHNFGSWTVTKKATCTTAGTQTRKCSTCGITEIQTIKATGHNYSTQWTVDKAATCTSEGSKSHHCLNCGARKDVTAIAKTAHNWTCEVVAPSYADEGYTYVECSKCGDYYYTDYTDQLKLANVKTASFTSSDNSVKMTWKKIKDADGYRVYKYNTSKKKWEKVATTSNTSYSFTKLKAGTTYQFGVKAYKKVNGIISTSAKQATLKTSTKPAKVNFKLTAGSKKATVKWSKVTGATGYIVYYKTSKNGSWKKLKTTTGTSYTKTGLTKGKTYWFTVKAYRKVDGKTYNGAFTTMTVKVK